MTQKRQKILDATLHLAVDTGIDAISTLNIAKKAEVAKATLFHHFQTKADLIDAVYKSIKSNFDYLSAPDNLTFNDQLAHMWRSNLNWAKENPHQIFFLNAYYTAMSIPNVRRLAAKKESTIALHNLIVRGQESKKVATEHADILVEFTHSLFMSTALLLHTQQEMTTEQYIEDSLSIIQRVIRL